MAGAARFESLRRIVQVVYALQAIAVLGGALGSGTIAAQFLFLVPALAALAIDYKVHARAAGNWLASHCRWQQRTVLWALAATIALFLVSAPLTLLVIGAYLPGPGLALIGLWAGYRVLRGWLTLRERQPMPVPMPLETP
jgi:uncharacterized membrane protein